MNGTILILSGTLAFSSLINNVVKMDLRECTGTWLIHRRSSYAHTVLVTFTCRLTNRVVIINVFTDDR